MIYRTLPADGITVEVIVMALGKERHGHSKRRQHAKESSILFHVRMVLGVICKYYQTLAYRDLGSKKRLEDDYT